MQRRARGHHVHHPMALARADVTTLDGIPVTTVARTLIDLAGCVEPHVLEEALDDALRRGLVRVAQLRRRLDASGRAGRRGTRLLGEMIEVRAGNGRVPESVFETRLSRVLRAAGLPAPVLQHGVGKYRLDFAYPALHVAIEADGFRWHSSRARWDRDIERRNALAVLGWTVIHVTWPQLQHKPEKLWRPCARRWPARGARSAPGARGSACASGDRCAPARGSSDASSGRASTAGSSLGRPCRRR